MRQPLALLELDDRPPMRSIDGISMNVDLPVRAASARPAPPETPSGRARRVRRNERSTPPARRPRGRTRTRRRNVRARRRRRMRSPESATARLTAAVSSQSKPARVPSRSMEVSRISPAPRSAASRAHATASRATGVVPRPSEDRAARRASHQSRRRPPGCRRRSREGA